MRTKEQIKAEYERWKSLATDDPNLIPELTAMTPDEREDAFYRDLAFGTGGLRESIGAGTNRMNVYVVAKASQGLSNYINMNFSEDQRSIVIGYDSRIKSDLFARVAASVFVANGIKVWLWNRLLPVPTVSFAVRKMKASTGVMITASHNPAQYNGYKVYGDDGCQITTEAASNIRSNIESVDFFDGVKKIDFNTAVEDGKIEYIHDEVLDKFIEAVKSQSVLYGEEIDRNIAIVYSPLNGTGLEPVTRVLSESGFKNITIVEEQRNPDGNFPTCPYPNPEIQEAMELGLRKCQEIGADLLITTDPDCDRCGIAVKSSGGEDYRLLSGNEVGLLLFDFICSQRIKHNAMPERPVMIKTIVTMDLAEKIAEHYGVKIINTLTGFKFIGEQIGRLEAAGRSSDYIFGFEESYGYLTGSYVRDKDAVNAAFMIAEMFAYYKMHGASLIERLEEIYTLYGHCLNTLHSYEFLGSSRMEKMGLIMQSFRDRVESFGGHTVIRTEDYKPGLNGLPPSNVLKFFTDCGSVVIRPSGTEPKLKAYISVSAESMDVAGEIEKQIIADIEQRVGA